MSRDVAVRALYSWIGTMELLPGRKVEVNGSAIQVGTKQEVKVEPALLDSTTSIPA